MIANVILCGQTECFTLLKIYQKTISLIM